MGRSRPILPISNGRRWRRIALHARKIPVAPVFSTDLNGYMGKEPLEIDEIMYGWRYLVGNFFCNLKAFSAQRNGIRQD